MISFVLLYVLFTNSRMNKGKGNEISPEGTIDHEKYLGPFQKSPEKNHREMTLTLTNYKHCAGKKA